MNKPMIITLSVGLLLLVAGIWAYLFFFGTPDDGGEVFSNLGILPEPATQPRVIDDTPKPNTVDVQSGTLRQLTTKPVAGYVTATNDVRFVEAGTGYIFSIDLVSGEQQQLTNTTVAGTVDATFSPNRSQVALTTYEGYVPTVSVGTIVDTQLDTIALEPGAEHLSWESNTLLRYSLSRDGTRIGYQQDLQDETREELFIFDVADSVVDWRGNSPVVWPAPAAELPSTAYEIDGTSLTPLPVRRSALQVLQFGDTDLFTMRLGESLESSVGTTTMAQSLLREKCADTLVDDTTLYCGGPILRFTIENYFDWLQGQHTSDDQVWATDVTTGVSTLIIDPERTSGRPLDIIEPQLDPTASAFFFINKTDQTLWMLDLDAA